MTARRRSDALLAAFGRTSRVARDTSSALCRTIQESTARRPSGLPSRLFEDWRNQFGLRSIAERRETDRRRRIDGWRRKWLGSEPNVDADLFLFAVQSFYAMTLKSIAARLAGADLACWESIESGEAFRARGVFNLVHGDVFQAAFHTSDRRMFDALSEISTRVSSAPIVSSNLCHSLRSLYLDLFPREVRHALGEYYTPAFLVDHVLEVVDFDPKGDQSFLDPMCGSGAFLSEILNRRLVDRRRTAAVLLNMITGIELHPLAALTARIAVFASVASLPCEKPVRIPIHQGDSILAARDRRRAPWPSALRIMSPLGDRELADDETAERLIGRELESAGVFGDAAGMVDDARALASLPKFDAIVGNPAWVGWESLPAEYRRATTPIWQAYGLFQQRGMEAILGGGKKDLSMLATYTAADAWLKSGGKLGFVVTESAFKSVGAARGFRRFEIGEERTESLKVLRVDDMTRLNPFANAATRSTILVLEKGVSTDYPVPFIQWSKIGRRSAVAEPIAADDPLSPWVSAAATVLPLLRRMLGESRIRAYEGINTGGANGVYWLRVLERTERGTLVVENDPSFGRTPLQKIRAEIESTYVYPLLRHQDLGRWRTASAFSILMLQDPTRRRGIDIEGFKATAPMSLAFIGRFEDPLRRRAAFKRYFTAANGRSAPFYTMFNFGSYTLAPFKVVWRRMIAPLEAAVVLAEGSKPPLPQETLCFIPCADRDEAFYYAGLLNSKVVGVASLATTQGSSKSFGAPHLLKLVELPPFDRTNDAHLRLVDVAQSSSRCEDDLDHAAAAIFGFTDYELGALKDEYDFLTT